MAPLGGLRALVKQFSSKHPLVFNSITYGSICGLAEITQQTIEAKPQYDISAVSRYGVIGSGFMAPVLYGWYRALDSYYPGRRWRIVVKKLILDSTILSIPLYSIFFLGTSLLEGQRDIFAEWKQKFLATYVIAMLFWVPLQAVNFAFVPQRHRVIFIAGCTFLEINVLCLIKRMK